MKFDQACLECTRGQIERILKLNKVPADERNRLRPLLEAVVESANIQADTPPDIAMRIYSLFNDETGLDDPFQRLKDESNRDMLEILPKLFDYAEASEDPIRYALTLSAVGNSIDYGIYDSHHSAEEIKAEAQHARFVIDQSDRLLSALDDTKGLLVILDNCGEAVLDKVLLDIIEKHYPNISITVAVRGAPVINDITRREAELIALTERYRVIDTGKRHPGIPNPGSDEFEDAFANADLIIAKGQGNFETERYDRRIFHLFKIKCEVVARDLDAPLGGIALYERQQNV